MRASAVWPPIPTHQVESVIGLGWASLTDRDLLDLLAGKFDVLVSVDKSLPFQQNLTGRPIGLVILRAYSNRLDDLAHLVPDLLDTLTSLLPGEVRLIGL